MGNTQKNNISSKWPSRNNITDIKKQCKCGCGTLILNHDNRGRLRYWAKGHSTKEPIEVSFFKKLKKTKTCWIWTGCKLKSGYGQIGRHGGPYYQTHRLSWIIANGPIPDNLQVLHRCDNPPCCNPDHLFLGTHDDNMKDKVIKNRQSRKINKDDVIYILKSYKSGDKTASELSKKYNLSRNYINDIIKRKTWAHIILSHES